MLKAISEVVLTGDISRIDEIPRFPSEDLAEIRCTKLFLINVDFFPKPGEHLGDLSFKGFREADGVMEDPVGEEERDEVAL